MFTSVVARHPAMGGVVLMLHRGVDGDIEGGPFILIVAVEFRKTDFLGGRPIHIIHDGGKCVNDCQRSWIGGGCRRCRDEGYIPRGGAPY